MEGKLFSFQWCGTTTAVVAKLGRKPQRRMHIRPHHGSVYKSVLVPASGSDRSRVRLNTAYS